MSEFGLKAKNLRKSRDLTIRTLGNELGISKSRISRYERGETEPPLSALRKYAEFFDVTLEYLCDDDMKYR